MIHDEKKIEDMVKWLDLTSSDIDNLKIDIKQYAEHIRKQTIEECRGCVPKKSQFNKLFDYDDCREEYLSALNDLE